MHCVLLASDSSEVNYDIFPNAGYFKTNSSPLADADQDKELVTIGSTVYRDGNASYDDDLGDVLTYQWTFTSYPGANPPALRSQHPYSQFCGK